MLVVAKETHEGAKLYRFISVPQERGAPMTRERNLDVVAAVCIKKKNKKRRKKMNKEKSEERAREYGILETSVINIDDGKRVINSGTLVSSIRSALQKTPPRESPGVS